VCVCDWCRSEVARQRARSRAAGQDQITHAATSVSVCRPRHRVVAAGWSHAAAAAAAAEMVDADGSDEVTDVTDFCNRLDRRTDCCVEGFVHRSQICCFGFRLFCRCIVELLRSSVCLSVSCVSQFPAVPLLLLFRECCSCCRLQPYDCIIIHFVE